MEAYYVMTYGAKSRSLPLLPPLFENNEAGGDFLAIDTVYGLSSLLILALLASPVIALIIAVIKWLTRH